MRVKTDRNDARSIAQLIRMGWFRPVHAKAMPVQEVRMLLTARKQVQAKPRPAPRLRTEGWADRHRRVRAAHLRSGGRPSDPGEGNGADAEGAPDLAGRIREPAP